MPVPIDSILKELKNDNNFLKYVTDWHTTPPREAVCKEMPEGIHPSILEALRAKNIDTLYLHQEEAFRRIRAGEHAVVVTPTASGKTLCYNLPILQRLLENPEARALYLFPTKALSQDQQSELNEVVLSDKLPVKICTYDGDTPQSLRTAARRSGRIIISNPDMLHTGILPNHPKWIHFFTSLEYIVIDELHTYRGVFGSHMTNLIRRIKRIARFYGADPQFICSSATIGNPKELAENILEKPVSLIDKNGAPSGEKHFILYNPPLVDRVQGIRKGTVNVSTDIAVKLLKEGIKTIIFAKSRIRSELIASYIKKRLANVYTDNSRIQVETYRGGYLPGERRSIEQGLRNGSIHGIVSTNALELGIDIGSLDAAILAGYPGTIASSLQQAGRAGRRNSLSVAILAASSSPTDQYIVRHPEYFFGSSPESARIDPDNIFILMDHIKCAVFELPFREDEQFCISDKELLSYLEENGTVRHTGGAWYWSDRSYPAEQISLRTAAPDNVVIVDTTKGRNAVIGEMDRSSAKELLFDHAVYIHRQNQYFVTSLDLENNRCYAEETNVNFYTDAIVKRDIHILEQDENKEHLHAKILIGDVLVRSQVTKYKKIRYHTHENVGYGDIFLPEDEMHTRSIVLYFPGTTYAGRILSKRSPEMQKIIIQKIANLLHVIIPIFLLCERRDIGLADRIRDPFLQFPAIYVYDNYPGGIGIAEGCPDRLQQILESALEMITACPCEDGCPSCIGASDEGPNQQQQPTEQSKSISNHKQQVVQFLQEWLKGEQ